MIPAAAEAHSPRTLEPAQIIAKLNAQRRANGLPAQVSENPDWSRKCQAHNRYMSLNGVLGHDEVRGRRGYSADGAWAGAHSVLSGSWSSWRRANPWQNAPLHLSQAFNPRLRVAGASETFGRECLTTFPGWDPNFTVATDTVYSYPRDHASAPYAQHAAEVPFTPQTKVGIPERATTGPYIYLWAFSPPQVPVEHTFQIVGYDENGSAIYADPNAEVPDVAPLTRLVAGSVTSSGGRSVPVKLIDDAQIDGIVGPGGAFILPIKPLRKRTAYNVTATFAAAPDAEAQHEYTYSFVFRTTSRSLR